MTRPPFGSFKHTSALVLLQLLHRTDHRNIYLRDHIGSWSTIILQPLPELENKLAPSGIHACLVGGHHVRYRQCRQVTVHTDRLQIALLCLDLKTEGTSSNLWDKLQGSDASKPADGMDWGTVQDLVRLIQGKQTLSKDTLASTKKSLKSPSKSLVCSTLTTLDSIAANCGTSVRSQLAEPRWVEMLLSVCFKNPTAALPICQLFSNWACSYKHEQLGHASNFAIQSLKQKGAIIPPPAPLAHHMVGLHNLQAFLHQYTQERSPKI